MSDLRFRMSVIPRRNRNTEGSSMSDFGFWMSAVPRLNGNTEGYKLQTTLQIHDLQGNL